MLMELHAFVGLEKFILPEWAVKIAQLAARSVPMSILAHNVRDLQQDLLQDHYCINVPAQWDTMMI